LADSLCKTQEPGREKKRRGKTREINMGLLDIEDGGTVAP
jgi:hypothetical protein